MKSIVKKVAQIAPGLALSVAVAIAARLIEGMLPIHVIGASVIALFIGMGINSIWCPQWLSVGLKFTSQKVLKFAIILLGASLSVQVVLNVGKLSLTVMTFTLLTCFGGGCLLGKALGLNWKLSNLLSVGTAICGGSAIAATAPVIDAEDRDVAYAMSATFLFDVVKNVLFPIMGKVLGFSDIAYGLWVGTAVNDTASVVAAGYAFSEAAGDFATMVKLTRTLFIIPVVLIFTYINLRIKKKKTGEVTGGKGNVLKLFPWFVVGFLFLAGCNSLSLIPAEVSAAAKSASKFLMVVALAAIGLKTSFKDIKKAGSKPMLYGLILSALVVVVAIGVEWCIGLV